MLELLLSNAEALKATINYRIFNFSQDFTYEECFNFVKNYEDDYKLILQWIPEHFQTEELCKAAFESCYGNIKCIPKKFRTKEMCEIAVRSNGILICAVPKKFITHELCKIAVKENPYAIQYISEMHITHNLCEIAVKGYPYAVQYIPEIYLTKDICDIVIKIDSAAAYIPTKILLKYYTKM